MPDVVKKGTDCQIQQSGWEQDLVPNALTQLQPNWFSVASELGHSGG